MFARQFEGCKEQLLKFLAEYLPKLGSRTIISLCVDVKEVCVAIFLRDKAARVRTASLSPLIAVSRR